MRLENGNTRFGGGGAEQAGGVLSPLRSLLSLGVTELCQVLWVGFLETVLKQIT